MTSQSWINKPIPSIIYSYTETKKLCSLVKVNLRDPSLYLSSFFQPETSVETISLQEYTSDLPQLSNTLFMKELQEKCPDFVEVYTDGSKINETAGAAFYIPREKFEKLIKLPPCISTYSAELTAIIQTLLYSILLYIYKITRSAIKLLF
jgi:hypothetical protein